MARIRTIKPEFWEDEDVGKLPIPCRLLFIGCWNFADDYGVIKANATLLKSQIFPYDENLRVSEIKKWLNALVDARMLIPIILDGDKKRPAEESYYIIRTFRSHQVLDKRYDKSYISKDKEYVKKLINKVLKNDDVNTTSTQRDYDVNTTSTQRDYDVNTTEEKEKEKEYKKESTNVDKKETDVSSCENEAYKTFISWICQNAEYCFKNMKLPSEKEFNRLKELYSGKEIAYIVSQIENRKDLRKRYTNLYRTVLNWAKKEYGQRNPATA